MDGNKHTGTATALVFLDMNGVTIDASEDALVTLVLDLAQGRADQARIALLLRGSTRTL